MRKPQEGFTLGFKTSPKYCSVQGQEQNTGKLLFNLYVGLSSVSFSASKPTLFLKLRGFLVLVKRMSKLQK